MWQKNSEGTTNAPTQKSATESETMTALVLVRSSRRQLTSSTMNPFPVIVRMDRIQPRIQTTIPFYYRYRSLAESSTLSSLKEKYDNFNLLTSGNNCGVFSFLSYEHNNRIRQFMIAKLRPIRRLFSRYCSWNLNEALSSTKDHFVETQCRSPWQLTLRHPFLFYNGPLVDNSCII